MSGPDRSGPWKPGQLVVAPTDCTYLTRENMRLYGVPAPTAESYKQWLFNAQIVINQYLRNRLAGD